MGQDLDRSVVVEERVQAVGGRLLARELHADALGEGGVGARLVAQAEQAGVNVGAVAAQPVVGVGPGGVDERPVGEQEHERFERVVGVVHDAAAHAGRVVGDDPAHHRRVDRGGVGPEPVAERGQEAVEVPAHDSRLRPHAAPAVEDAARSPKRSQLHEDVVGHGLAGQRRAGGAEREPAPAVLRVAEQRAHLVEVLRADDDLRDQPVDRGVDRTAQTVQRTGEDALGREQAA